MSSLSAKARVLISNDGTTSREGFTSWSWENVLPICRLSLCILRPLLSLDSRGSVKCRSIQGSFHVPVTPLESLYGITQQPSPSPFQVLTLYSWWLVVLLLRVSSPLCASLIECIYVCLHVRGDVWADVATMTGVSTRMYTCVRTYVCVCVCVGLLLLCCLNRRAPCSQMCLCLLVSTYRSAYSEREPQPEWSRANPFSADCASSLPLSWAVIFELCCNGFL